MNTLLIINALLFAFLGMVWTRKTWINVFLKFALWILALVNLLVVLGLVK